MDRSTILDGINEILAEVLPNYDSSHVNEDTMVVNISLELDSLTVQELIVGLENRYEMEIEEGGITAKTKVSDIVDLVLQAQTGG